MLNCYKVFKNIHFCLNSFGVCNSAVLIHQSLLHWLCSQILKNYFFIIIFLEASIYIFKGRRKVKLWFGRGAPYIFATPLYINLSHSIFFLFIILIKIYATNIHVFLSGSSGVYATNYFPVTTNICIYIYQNMIRFNTLSYHQVLFDLLIGKFIHASFYNSKLIRIKSTNSIFFYYVLISIIVFNMDYTIW